MIRNATMLLDGNMREVDYIAYVNWGINNRSTKYK